MKLKKMCDNPHQMIASFRDVGISLNIDGSEDNQMKFQGQGQGLPDDIDIGYITLLYIVLYM